MITYEDIRKAVANTALQHPIKKVSCFGSYANGLVTNESDLDLLIEFDKPAVSLFTLSEIKFDLENQLKIPVDVIHFPLPEGSIIELNEVKHIYG